MPQVPTVSPARAHRTLETDVCILGSGISAAMAAERLSEESTATITVIEAGDRIFNLDRRFETRGRFLDYAENPWPNDHIPKQTGRNIQSRSMCVGGLGLHWGGTVPRFTPEDFRQRSMYGVGTDWPVDYDALDPFYQEAEERMGVAGTWGPRDLDPRSRDYPMPPLPLSWNLQKLEEWAEKSGIPYWPNPVAKNSEVYRGRGKCTRCDTCTICPTGAKYTPDLTFLDLLERRRIELHSRMLVRRLVVRAGSMQIERALAVDRDRPDETVEIRARTFVLACGYAWSPHLLLLSQSERFPDGLANSSGLVGAYMTGHRSVNAFVEVPFRLYPGIYEMDSLLSKKFQRPGPQEKYLRHDLRIWETSYDRQARQRDDSGRLLLGDDALADWRERTTTGTARMRGYYDVIPDRSSRLTLDHSRPNLFGDPTLRIDLHDDPVSAELRGWSEDQIVATFERIVTAGGGKLLTTRPSPYQDHPGGGCRMGDDPSHSVVDAWGRSHDHDNLWVLGAPTIPSGGCNNGTLTFCALSLRTAAAIARELPARDRVEHAVPHPGVAEAA